MQTCIFQFPHLLYPKFRDFQIRGETRRTQWSTGHTTFQGLTSVVFMKLALHGDISNC